ncbi:hypothetical protein [Pleomorphovibrio marinus]|uniref:hypothetical protein n=1 Tax=Pleomorphovibrio marinus TaxID=2164132 RepID=UPI000E09F9A6|nr:hypothetical protein [Pleomorphovibrio marinus]
MSNYKFSRLAAFALFFLVLVFGSYAQSKIKLNSNHPEAEYFTLGDTNEENPVRIGVGNVEIKLAKDSKNRVMVTKSGYEPVIAEFPRTEKWDKENLILLENRLVQLEVDHEDATITFGEISLTGNAAKIVIPKNETVSLMVSKQGYAPKELVFHNKPDMEQPPVSLQVSLKNRIVDLDVNLSDAVITVDGANPQTGKGEILVPFGSCVEVVIARDGFLDVVKEYCSNADSAPPIAQKIVMEDRVVTFAVSPADASITVNGQMEGIGTHEVNLLKGKCFNVEIRREGFMTFTKNYCNQGKLDDLPVVEKLSMVEDEAYASSVATEIANSRVPLTIKKSISSSDAWKILISIITREFDVLETVDFNAGYLISAWEYDEFNKGDRTIRNRVIITNSGSTNENNYAVKFVSQLAEGKVDARDDAKFKDWNRMLKKYHELMDEIELRLQ